MHEVKEWHCDVAVPVFLLAIDSTEARAVLTFALAVITTTSTRLSQPAQCGG
jgi:hypothetical protein